MITRVLVIRGVVEVEQVARAVLNPNPPDADSGVCADRSFGWMSYVVMVEPPS